MRNRSVLLPERQDADISVLYKRDGNFFFHGAHTKREKVNNKSYLLKNGDIVFRVKVKS